MFLYKMFPRFHYLVFYLCMISSVVLLVIVLTSGNETLSKQLNVITEKTINTSGTKSLRDILRCNDKSMETNIEYHGEYLIFKNFVKAEKAHKCDESITLSAPADYRFLDNVVPLVERWNGPISVALYAPGYDFFTSLQCIAYLRMCSSNNELVKKYVTFHLFFEHEHTPNQVS